MEADVSVWKTLMRRFQKTHAAQFFTMAMLCLALAGCSGVSAPSSGGPPTPTGGTGFTAPAATQLWLRQFGTGNTSPTPGTITATTGVLNSGDILTGIAADPSGNVVVSGYTFGAFPGFSNPNHMAQGFAAKFDSTDKQLWLQQFGAGASDYLNAIATDTEGDIFAVGFTTGAFPGATNTAGSPEAVVLELDANGNLLWLRQFSAGSGIDIRAVAVDGNGDLLVTGVLTQNTQQPETAPIQLTAQQAFVAKLSAANGQTIWQQTVGTSGITILNAIATDTTGDAYVAGEFSAPASQSNPSMLQMLAMKLSAADGSTIWQQKTIGNSNGGESLLRGIAVDSQDNAVVSGLMFGANEPYSFIAKLNASGQQVWLSSFGAMTQTYVDNVGMDAAGNVLVAGSTYAALLPEFQLSTDDVFLAKFDSGGHNVWLQQFGTGNEQSGIDLIIGPLPTENQVQVAVDSQGNAILGGITSGQFPGFTNPAQATEPFVAKFGP
jgi:hypothetical protein